MRRIILLLLLTLAVVNFAYAQFQNDVISFRSKALGEIINDDLDLIYDPIELRYVYGIRLYTNLSNLTSTNEEILNDHADDEFLIGFSFKNALINNLYNSFLVRFQNATKSNYITLDPDLSGPLSSIGHNGSYTDEYTSYIDYWPYDGVYDTKTMISQTKSNFTIDDSYGFILNNTYTMNQLTLGLKLSAGREVSDHNTASFHLGSGKSTLSSVWPGDPDFSLNFSNYSIPDDYIMDSWGENGDFLTRFKSSYLAFNGAFMMPSTLPQIGNAELRLDLGYMLDKYSDKMIDSYAGRIQHFQLALTDYDSSYHESDSYNNLTEWDGGTLQLGASIKKVFNPQAERKNDGYWQAGFNVNFSSYTYADKFENSISSTDYFFDGMDTLKVDSETKTTILNTTNDTGDEKMSVYAIGAKTNIPLGEKIYFGIGGLYRFSRIKRETNYVNSALDKLEYSQIDTLNDNDYTIKTLSEQTADRTWQNDVMDVIVPVGLEYKFTNNKKWAARFGAIFRYSEFITNDAKQITNSVPPVTITEWKDGTIDVENPPSQSDYESTSSQTKTITSTTIFTYGLGYMPTENLQIDLLGFFGTTNNSILDSQFYRNLRLSFSIRF